MKVTLGGDRIGSGSGMQVAMHNYEMSTHNLKQKFSSTMGVASLIPCLCIPAMRGDYFDIDINAAARTLPTKGPLFSTFKMQVDLYDVPMRLYQALLHNNAIRLGMNMSRVKLPQLQIITRATEKWKNGEFAGNALLKYLGMSGIGTTKTTGDKDYSRNINAIPALAYYDIFKNYYANKQEEKAYIITTNEVVVEGEQWKGEIEGTALPKISIRKGTPYSPYGNKAIIAQDSAGDGVEFALVLERGQGEKIDFGEGSYADGLFVNIIIDGKEDEAKTFSFKDIHDNEAVSNSLIAGLTITADIGHYTITYDGAGEGHTAQIGIIYTETPNETKNQLTLQDFNLDNIDEMRLDLLSYHTLGSPFIISKVNQTPNKPVYLPYSALTAVDENGVTKNQRNLNGICIKTYQSDLFNNWLNTEWIEGENGIAEMSKVAVTDGAIYMDALLFAKKTYNLLNRVAAADGTYQSWLDTVYTESPKRHIETPMFVGGLSTEIVFEEIVQTSPAEGGTLGTLGGKGTLLHREGGNAYIEVDEPSFIIGIVSITPRVFYTQGNEFYMTELKSVDDMHKPEFDGIGFQNLLGERMCWTDTIINGSIVDSRTVVGKVPAWIEYMTAVDKAYGEFTDVNKQGFMILNRDYSVNEYGVVQDFTTYVDPSKYNYAFAETALDSQNFWVQVEFDIKARRKMSAREIPNL